ncbi:MAG: biotin--[acetyl-CoA-carboxylase] ligase [Endomicrobium sp.]|jgi:BirA family biotin operon repressor/biotin-[acetyl-CoA-carboxylase] ligase|nr:biotin--[acetyl-CoA-carboxylase] ligase [Endomicrobium sp.]
MKFSPVDYAFIRSNEFYSEYEVRTNPKVQFGIAIICRVIRYYKELESTQIVVKELAKKGFDEGIVVIAEKQTGGYGCGKKKWVSNVGGLWFSMLLKPVVHPNEISKLTLLLGITLGRVFKKRYGINSEIKWPNDILVLEKKIAGIITEMSVKDGETSWVAAGIGVNINNELPEYLKNISISLRDVLRRKTHILGFVSAFFDEFRYLYFDFKKSGFEGFLEEYNDKIAYKNRNIIVDNGYHDVITGINLGIDGSGRLIVKTKNKLEKTMSRTVKLAENKI